MNTEKKGKVGRPRRPEQMVTVTMRMTPIGRNLLYIKAKKEGKRSAGDYVEELVKKA